MRVWVLPFEVVSRLDRWFHGSRGAEGAAPALGRFSHEVVVTGLGGKGSFEHASGAFISAVVIGVHMTPLGGMVDVRVCVFYPLWPGRRAA